MSRNSVRLRCHRSRISRKWHWSRNLPELDFGTTSRLRPMRLMSATLTGNGTRSNGVSRKRRAASGSSRPV
jgi:hypothetical protein